MHNYICIFNAITPVKRFGSFYTLIFFVGMQVFTLESAIKQPIKAFVVILCMYVCMYGYSI